ncbi:MAG: iron ABC transporter permease [Candidatus Omnitrophica bacterium]|nr:iron ABC transporter permease [Candidatus Omnitrophota bacterium]
MYLKRNFLFLGALLFIAIIFGLIKGAVNIPFLNLLHQENRIILDMRALRILTAILVGSGLATSGITLQAILKNPLAEPYLLGISSGAGLATIIAVILGVSQLFAPLAAFTGALISILLVYHLALEGNRISDKSLILSGVIISIIFSAIIVFLVSISGDKALHEMTWWLWGGLQTYDWRLIFLVTAVVATGICVIYLFSQDLNAISMGEEEAMHLGIDVHNVKKILIIVTAFITASLICICGIIGFVGLIVPHIMRLLVGFNHKILIPAACIGASAFMVVCDIFSRTLFSPVEIPIGVITAIVGAPIFIILLKRKTTR